MANVPESSSYDAGIYQLEIADEVLGGVNGKSNAQAKGLANRTKWLKDQVDTLNGLKGKGIAAFSIANGYVGGDQVIYDGNIWVANTTIVPGAWNATQWNVQLPTAAQFANDRKAATTEFVQRALGSMAGMRTIGTSTTLTVADTGKMVMLGSAAAITITMPLLSALTPGACITLKNDDSGTVTVQRQGSDTISADGLVLNSILLRRGEWVTLTCHGVWRAVGSAVTNTLPQFDSSISAASTEFVQRALGNMAGVRSISTNTTLTAADTGDMIVLAASAAITVTLPLLSALPDGACIVMKCDSNAAGVVTVQRQGTDMISPDGNTVTSITVSQGEWVILTRHTVWRAFGSALVITQPKLTMQKNIATTEFVINEGDRFSGAAGINVSVNTTLLNADRGGVHYVLSPGLTITLPETGIYGYIGSCFTIQARHDVTISRSGTTNQIVSANGTTANTLVVKKGETITLMDNFNNWVVVRDGFGADSFTASFSSIANYQRLPSGLIIQWGGFLISAGGTYTGNFPIAFPTECTSFVVSHPGGATPYYIGGDYISASQYRVDAFTTASVRANIGFRWVAFGR
jgi:hypothetical protein